VISRRTPDTKDPSHAVSELREMPFRRDRITAVLAWPLCAMRGHRDDFEIAAADTVSFTEAAAIIAGLMPVPEPNGQTVRYSTCRCGAELRSEPG
jgi:hypothetical protein